MQQEVIKRVLTADAIGCINVSNSPYTNCPCIYCAYLRKYVQNKLNLRRSRRHSDQMLYLDNFDTALRYKENWRINRRIPSDDDLEEAAIEARATKNMLKPYRFLV